MSFVPHGLEWEAGPVEGAVDIGGEPHVDGPQIGGHGLEGLGPHPLHVGPGQEGVHLLVAAVGLAVPIPAM